MNVAAVLAVKQTLLPSLKVLHAGFKQKAEQFNDIIKIGRTHTQDATPLTLGNTSEIVKQG